MTYHTIQCAVPAVKTVCGESGGTVYCVNSGAVYVQTDGGMIALQTEDTVLSPIGFQMRCRRQAFREHGIRVGEPVIFAKGCICFPASDVYCRINSDGGNAMRVCGGSSERIAQKIAGLEKVIWQSQTAGIGQIFRGEEIEEAVPVYRTIKRCLTDGYRMAGEQNWPGTASRLSHVIGLGIGLTPSGDDFLEGMFAGLLLAGQWEHPLRQCLDLTVRRRLDRTNLISRAFLRCAADGLFSEAVQVFATWDSLSEATSGFERMGNSSGLDMLCGIYYGACILGGTRVKRFS